MNQAYAPLAANEVRGRIALLVAGLVVLAGLIGLGLTFLWPSSTGPALSQSFDAGQAAGYAPASIHYFEEQHLYLVRRSDGSFVALYDWNARAQGQYQRGDEGKEACRVQVLSPDSPAYEGDLGAIRADYAPEPGLENVVLRSGCDGTSFDALGRHGFGPSPGDLDRFPLFIDSQGHVIVTLAQRQCQPLSPCLPLH